MHTLQTVSDLMTTDVFTFYPDQNLQVIREFMKWRNIRHIPVTDRTSKLVGLVTHRDMLEVSISRLAGIPEEEAVEIYQNIAIAEIMRGQPIYTAPNVSLKEAARQMVKNKYGCLPVVENDRLVGIITEADFVRAFAEDIL